ncbi:MAG: hypothetical protein C4555_03140 [Dehalococcoidia bacterium]|nr:MAG: hypothetical protein C4555_03140 [Dehalococcoidia bacterium]
MEITKEYLEEQIKIASEGKDKALADANAYAGAIQAFQMMLKRLEEKPAESGEVIGLRQPD